MTGALVALGLLAYAALHEWADTMADLGTRARLYIAGLVICVGLLGWIVEEGVRALIGVLA